MKQTGNTILVTGGGSGIGEALAQRFHDLGNTVIVAGRRQEALDRAIAGREHMAAMTLDIGDAGALEDFARRAIAEPPDLNVLINNAGIMRFESLDRRSSLTRAQPPIPTHPPGPPPNR